MRWLTEFVFNTFDEAKETYIKLSNLINKQGYATYADLYFINGKQKFVFPNIYNIHGWVDIQNVKIESSNNRWFLKMPPITNIENKIKMIKESKNNHERTNSKNN